MTSQKLSILVRNFSTSNASNQLVKPPVQVFGIVGRYACALYSAASKKKSLEAVEKDLIRFQQSLKTDARLREIIENPLIKRAQKAEGLKAVAEKVSYKTETSNFLQALAENGRLTAVDGVINAFKLIMAAHRGEVTCEVTSARELDADQKQKIQQVLKTFVKPNESILLTTKVDPAIIGGMIVSIDDRYVDMSVAKKIKKFTEIISAPV